MTVSLQCPCSPDPENWACEGPGGEDCLGVYCPDCKVTREVISSKEMGSDPEGNRMLALTFDCAHSTTI